MYEVSYREGRASTHTSGVPGVTGWRGPREGDIWTNPNLAKTFLEVAAKGKKGFYEGRVAEELVSVLEGMGGTMTLSDLAAHKTTFPEPIKTEYRGVEVWEVPPNGQGKCLGGSLLILSLPPPPPPPPPLLLPPLAPCYLLSPW
jgi:hypothetical protein